MSDTIESTQMERQTGLQLAIDDADWKLRSDGLTVRGRIVPFLEPAWVIEDGRRVREQFLQRSLTAMCQYVAKRGNAAFVSLNLDHDETFQAKIGRCRAIEQTDDGAWADFRLYESPDLDKVRTMLDESHRGLSVMFDDIVRPRLIDGVISRVQVAIRHVAATPFPTYAGAQISAVRDDEHSDPPTFDELTATPALDEWRAYLATISHKSA